MLHPAVEGHPLNLLFWKEGFLFFLPQNHGLEKISSRSDQFQDQRPALGPKHQMWMNKWRGTEKSRLGH